MTDSFGPILSENTPASSRTTLAVENPIFTGTLASHKERREQRTASSSQTPATAKNTQNITSLALQRKTLLARDLSHGITMNESRPERKRGKEKQRRDALKEAIENLQDKLLQHDETFRQEESSRRTSTTASRASRTAKSATKGEESWSFTKVEIINQAIHTIQEVTTQNNEMQELLLEIAKDPTQAIPLLKAAADLPSRPSAGFHRGVGPLAAVPAPAPQEEQASKKRKSNDDNTATGQTNHLAEIESTAAEPLRTSVPVREILLSLRKPSTQDSLDAREYESSNQLASICHDHHAHSVTQPGSGAELQALLVRASLQNRQRQMAYSTLRLQAQLQLQSSMNAASAIGMPTAVPQMRPAPDNSATAAIRNLLAGSNPTTVPFRTDGIGLIQQAYILDPTIWGRALLGGRVHQQYSTQETDRALRQTEMASSRSLSPTNQP